ncbi:MAG: hypothetical protein DCC50_13245 [Acidobacteria bacterium]|nr:MAG: hypothetical protein DCC50_13245 [Acidobacteriota bacterium]
MTEHDRGHEPEAQHEVEHEVEHGEAQEARRGPRHATYSDEQTKPGRAFPLLAPVVVVIVAGIILLLFVVLPGR